MLHEQLRRVLAAVNEDPDLADIVCRAIDALTPERIRIEQFLQDREVVLFHQIPCRDNTLAVDVLKQQGYRKQSLRLDGVAYAAWVHGECRYPKAVLHVLLQKGNENGKERQSVSGHAGDQ